jgi:hypothetical protein
MTFVKWYEENREFLDTQSPFQCMQWAWVAGRDNGIQTAALKGAEEKPTSTNRQCDAISELVDVLHYFVNAAPDEERGWMLAKLDNALKQRT